MKVDSPETFREQRLDLLGSVPGTEEVIDLQTLVSLTKNVTCISRWVKSNPGGGVEPRLELSQQMEESRVRKIDFFLFFY